MTSPKLQQPSSLQLFGVPVKYFVLLLLVVQNSMHTLTIRYSLGIRKDTYSLSTVVVIVELFKLLLSMVMIAREQPSSSNQKVSSLYSSLTTSSLPMAIPALVYFVQKILSFIGLRNIDPQVYAIITQLKLLSTAIFSVFFLKKHLSFRKWRALFLLLVGVIIIQLAAQAHSKKSDGEDADKAFMIGITACLGIAVLSGFAGVYIERALKTSHLTIWDRNFQLSLHGFIMAIFGLLIFESEALEKGFFHGWNSLTWILVLIFAFGGILVAMIGKYASMILKGFATGVAIILTSVLSHFLFGGILDINFAMGVCVVMTSIFNYQEVDVVPAVTADVKESGDVSLDENAKGEANTV